MANDEQGLMLELIRSLREESKESSLTMCQMLTNMITSLKESNDNAHKEIIKKLDQQNGRIGKNERFRFLVVGIAIGSGLISGLGANALLNLLF